MSNRRNFGRFSRKRHAAPSGAVPWDNEVRDKMEKQIGRVTQQGRVTESHRKTRNEKVKSHNKMISGP